MLSLATTPSTGWALLSLMAFTCNAESMCDIYEVQIQANFSDNLQIPCSKQEMKTIELLLHSLIQVDSIVGLNSFVPVQPLYLGFQAGSAELAYVWNDNTAETWGWVSGVPIEEGLGVTVLAQKTVPDSLRILPPSRQFPRLGRVGVHLVYNHANPSETVLKLVDYVRAIAA